MGPSGKPKALRSQYKSLCSLLCYFEGCELTIELKTGHLYRGILSSADEYMNLVLEDAERLTTGNQHPKHSTSAPPKISVLHIRGPTIRYIHFADDADLPSLIRVGQDRARAAANKYGRGVRKRAK